MDVSKSKAGAKGGFERESGKVSLLHSTVGGVWVVTSVLITFFRIHKIVNDKEENSAKEKSKKPSVMDESTSTKVGEKKSKGKESTETKAGKVSLSLAQTNLEKNIYTDAYTGFCCLN